MPKNNSEMNISVTFRGTEATPAIKKYAMEKLSAGLTKYLTGDVRVQIVLSVNKRFQTAEVKVHSPEYEVTGKEATDSLYSAIDKVVDNLIGQLRRQKERIKSHKPSGEQAAEF